MILVGLFPSEKDALQLQRNFLHNEWIYLFFRMEVKVYVEGVQRIVCGVTEKTTCQEVVIALAQALSK